MFAINVGIIDRCHCRSDISTFRSREVVTRRAEGCRKGSRRTDDLLYIYKAVIKEFKSRNKNLAMAWIDYKKAEVPYSGIIECLDLFGVAGNIKSLLVNSMEK